MDVLLPFAVAAGLLAGPDRAPVHVTIERLGGHEAAWEHWNAAKRWKDDSRRAYAVPPCDPFPGRYRAWCEYHWAQADRLYAAYDRLTDALSNHYGGDDKSARYNLERFRDLVGEEAYWSGRLPPVPVLWVSPNLAPMPGEE